MTISTETKREITQISQEKKVMVFKYISYLLIDIILIFQQVNGEHDIDIQERSLVWSRTWYRLHDIMIWIIPTVKPVNQCWNVRISYVKIPGILFICFEKLKRVIVLLLSELQPKIQRFKLWSPNSDIHISNGILVGDHWIYEFVFFQFFLLINFPNIWFGNVQQMFNTAVNSLRSDPAVC